METIETSTAVPGANGYLSDPARQAKFARAFGGAIIAAAGVGLAAKAARAQAVTDADILNFALNLEYLEAEFYTLATTGKTLDQVGIGVNGVGTQGSVVVKSNPQVPFSNPLVQQFAQELATDEQNHVKFLRSALGASAVARPQIDLLNSFNAAANAAGIGPAFDPFANDTAFLLGAFVFEDVGVTAYHGAAGLLTNKAAYLGPAAGILAVEAYHAGSIRTRIYAAGSSAQTISNQIAALRAKADGTNNDDYGVANGGQATIVDADANAIAFSRTTSQVLAIVYLGSASTPGGFFPNGLNGTIR